MTPLVITTADRPDLGQQGKSVLPGWPEFIFHDQVSAEWRCAGTARPMTCPPGTTAP